MCVLHLIITIFIFRFIFLIEVALAILSLPKVEEDQQLMKCLLYITNTYLKSPWQIYIPLPYFIFSKDNPNIHKFAEEYVKEIHGSHEFGVLNTITEENEIVDTKGHTRPAAVVIMLLDWELDERVLIKFLYELWLNLNRHDDVKIVILSNLYSNNTATSSYLTDIFKNTWVFKDNGAFEKIIRFADTIVLRYNENSKERTLVDVYGWLPKEQTDHCVKEISKIKLFDTWNASDNGFIHNSELFPKKEVTNFHGCPIRIVSNNFEKSFLQYANKLKDPEYNTMYQISRLANFTFTIGEETPDSWIHNIRNGETDIFISLESTRQLDLETFIALGYPIIIKMDSMKMYVPIGSPIPNWQALIKTFSPKLWFKVIVAHFLFSIVYFVFQKKDSSIQELNKGSFISFLYTLQLSLGMPIAINTKSYRFLTLIIICIFYYVQMNTAYKSSLTSFLINPGRQNPIASLEDFAGSDLNIASMLTRGTKDFNLPVANKSYMGRRVLNLEAHFINRLVCKGDMAIFSLESLVKFALSFTDKIECKPEYLEFDKQFYYFFKLMRITSNSFFKQRFIALYKRLVTSGLVNKWQNDYLLNNSKIFIKEIYTPTEILTMKHLQGAYYILYFGLFFGIIVFVIELFYSRNKNIFRINLLLKSRKIFIK